jgi:hypothetical protein
MLEIVYTSALLYYPTSLFTLLWLRAKWDNYIIALLCLYSHIARGGVLSNGSLTISASFPRRFCRQCSSDSLFWLTLSTWYCHPKIWGVVYLSS